MFDCNVYLDVARLLGSPFTWDEFNRQAVRLAQAPVPAQDRAFDSLRALAVTTSGRMVGAQLLEAWTSHHINDTVAFIAAQPTTPDPHTGRRGLGWSQADAQALPAALIDVVTNRSNGGNAGDPWPDGNPPLDHEDGRVFGLCRKLAGDDPLCRVYCVTWDAGFLDAYNEGQLSSHSTVMRPSRFVQLVRQLRAAHAMPRPKP